jgi:outer membrane protein OmpA-like peptidoglycan-associated protein
MTGVTEIIKTDPNGEYLKPLEDKHLKDRGSYNLKLEKQGYLTKTVTYNCAFYEEGKYAIHKEMDISLDKIELGNDLSAIIDIEPIYFDLGKATIRKDAAVELDKIVKILNENPNMVIELGSHTDSRGSASSNMKLSDKRAKASANYIKERITNPDRITGKGYGEDKLVNGCSDGIDCTEEQHQNNRRTEFIIVKM